MMKGSRTFSVVVVVVLTERQAVNLTKRLTTTIPLTTTTIAEKVSRASWRENFYTWQNDAGLFPSPTTTEKEEGASERTKRSAEASS
jgi:hypothetical protein